MKLKLTLKERIIIFGCLANPRKASIADWNVLDEAKKTIGLSQADHDLYKIKQEADQIKWENSEEGNKEKDYEIPNRAYEIIVADLRKMDEKGEFPNSDFAKTAAKFIVD